MIFIYRTVDDRLICPDTIEKDCWINLVHPTEAELRQVSEATGLDYDFLKYPLQWQQLLSHRLPGFFYRVTFARPCEDSPGFAV